MARNKGTSRRSRHSASLWSLLLFVVGLSVFEYVEHGRVTWHQKLYYAVQDLRGSAQSTQPGAAPASPETSNTLSGWVARVSDGDTFTLNVSGLEAQVIRLYGIDAPERDQAFGREAARALTRNIDGREVRVDVMDVDTYGRVVGTVYVAELNVNLAMAEQGYAWWYEYYADDARELELAEERARAQQRGLWSQRNPVAPWDWRRR